MAVGTKKEKPPFARGPFRRARRNASAYLSGQSRHPKPDPGLIRGSVELLLLLFAGFLFHIRFKLAFGLDSLPGCRFLFCWHRHLLLIVTATPDKHQNLWVANLNHPDEPNYRNPFLKNQQDRGANL